MYTITLVNMPFANLRMPSIALAQLASVVGERLGDRVRVQTVYLNHEVAHYLGLDLYDSLTSALEANNSGLGDWLFRQVAFPGEPDNTEPYFRRYFPGNDPELEERRRTVLDKRAGFERFLAKLIRRYKLDRSNLVGMTSMFAQNTACFALARLLKQRSTKLVTVMGGANCEAPMGAELARHVESVDFVFSGPSLVSFPRFVEHQIDGEPERCHQIRGVFSASNLDHMTVGPGSIGEELPIEVPVPLDYEPFLESFEHNFPSGRLEPSITFETSRGCWWGERSHCTFCGLNGTTMKYRGMPSGQALELFRDLFARYGDRVKRFESVDNILPREYLTEVFPELEPPPGVSIFYEVKADLKAREMEVLSAAGVTEIQPGIESLATSTLKLMGKGTTAFHNVTFLKSCVRYGIRPAWNLLIGFPGESGEVYRKYLEDIPRLVHLPPPAGAFPVRFDRYSPYFTRADHYGLDLSPYDFYRYVYPFPEETLANLAYYFEDVNYRAAYLDQMITWQGRLTAAVSEWKERWQGSDGRPRATVRLDLREGAAPAVRDTRSGEVVEHRLDELELSILARLDEKAWRPDAVARRLESPARLVEAAIGRLYDLELLFHEDGRYSSVVLDESEEVLDRHADDSTFADPAARFGRESFAAGGEKGP